MIDGIRWVLKKDGQMVLQAYDGYVWFDVEVVEEQ